MKSFVSTLGICLSTLVVTLSAQVSQAKGNGKVATPEYWGTVAGVAVTTYTDAYMTSHYVGHTRDCEVEVWAPWLYGRRAPDSRVFAVMTAEVAANSMLAYYLKKRHSRFWMVPMLAMGTAHGMGAIHNLTTCPD